MFLDWNTDVVMHKRQYKRHVICMQLIQSTRHDENKNVVRLLCRGCFVHAVVLYVENK